MTASRVVRARYPEVAEALDWLGRFAPARLTGTGACVFAAVRDCGRRRERYRGRVPDRWQGFVARGLQSLAAAWSGWQRRRWTDAAVSMRDLSATRVRSAGVSPSGKAAGFDPAIRRFESFHPSHYGSTWRRRQAVGRMAHRS